MRSFSSGIRVMALCLILAVFFAQSAMFAADSVKGDPVMVQAVASDILAVAKDAKTDVKTVIGVKTDKDMVVLISADGKEQKVMLSPAQQTELVTKLKLHKENPTAARVMKDLGGEKPASTTATSAPPAAKTPQ